MKKTKALFSSLTLILASILQILVFASPVRAAVDTCTWIGGGADNNMTTAGNWTGCDNSNIPENGDNLTFPAATSSSYTVVIDNITSIGSINVSGAANPSGYGITLIQDGTPAPLTIAGNIIVGTAQNLSVVTETVFNNDTTVLLASSDSSFTISGSLMDLGSNTLTFEYVGFAGLSSSSNYTELPTVTFLGATSGLSAGSAGTSIVLRGVDMYWLGQGTSYTGPVLMDKSILRLDSDANVGATSAGITMTNSQLRALGSNPVTINEPLTINGNLFGTSGKEISYEAIGNPSVALNITNTTLQSDISTDPYTANITFSGTINGGYLIGVSQVYTVSPTSGHLVISATTNNSKVVNGDYIVVTEFDGSITDNQPSQSVIIESGDTVTINGARGNVIVSNGATLKGTGTVADVSVLSAGKIAAGTSPGCINTGNLTFSGSSALDVEINGPTACTEYDRTNVTGTVNLGSSAGLNVLKLSTYTPAVNTSFTIINNDSNDAVTGTFSGLAEAATFTQDGVTYRINYAAGDGNDVVLTVTALPGAPNTGIAQVASYTGMLVFGLIAVVGAFALNRRSVRK